MHFANYHFRQCNRLTTNRNNSETSKLVYKNIAKDNHFVFPSGLAAVFDGLVWHGVKGLKIY